MIVDKLVWSICVNKLLKSSWLRGSKLLIKLSNGNLATSSNYRKSCESINSVNHLIKLS